MGPIALSLIKEVLLAMVAKVGWRIVAERFLSRLVVWGLETLMKMSTNTVVRETLNDVLLSLSGKGLTVIEQKIEQVAQK